MRRHLLALIALVLGVTTLFAQTTTRKITGEVRDQEGTLAGASIFLIQNRATEEVVAHTISDTDGLFSMNVPEGNYILGISFIGYALYTQPIEVTAEREGRLDLGTITLEAIAEELQTVVVQGRAVRVRTQPDGFTVNVRELRKRTNDALDLLKLIPKVQVKGEQLSVIGKEKVLVKVGSVLQRVAASEVASLLKGYDSGLIEKVEVITQPPLRDDPDGNTAMIIIHTSSIFKEYMGGVLGTEEMWGGKDNYRYGGYGSLLYNRHGFFASIAPSLNFNGSKHLERQTYRTEDYLYQAETPSTGHHNYMGIRGTIQYDYSTRGLLGLALSWNRSAYNNQFESQEQTKMMQGAKERLIDNQNTYKTASPKLTATAYWESLMGQHGNKTWLEVAYFNLSSKAQVDYIGHEHPLPTPILQYRETNHLNTSGVTLNNDYAIYLDSERKYLFETGLKGHLSVTRNHRSHDEERTHQRTNTITQDNQIRWDESILMPYLSGSLRLSDQWWMRLGLRYVGILSHLKQVDTNSTEIPDLSKYHDAWLPTLHISYTPVPAHQFTWLLNSAITHPKFEDLNPFVWQSNERSFYQGNPNLRPQVNYTSSIGYTYGGVLSFKGRLRSASNIITPLSTMKGNEIYTQVENAQNSLFLGVEASYYFDKLSWMIASVEGYYGRSKYTSTKQFLLPEAYSNEWGLYGYLDFTFNKSRTWTGFLSGEYTGRKQTTISTLEPQYNVDLGTSVYLFDRRLALSVAGLHLFSVPYKGVGHRQGYSFSFNNRYDYPTIYISISYKFSNAKDTSTSRPMRTTQDIERRF